MDSPHDFGHPHDARDRRDVSQEIEIEVYHLIGTVDYGHWG
jgi:hypothetical protein